MARRRAVFDDAFVEALAGLTDGATRLAYLHCGDREAAADAVAEAIARIYPRWRRGQVEALGPYLRTTVVNEVRRGGRRRRVARRHEPTLVASERGPAPGLDDRLAERDALVTALQRLPERQRLAVVLRHHEQLSVAETAAHMGVSEGTVKSTTARGLEALREILAEVSA